MAMVCPQCNDVFQQRLDCPHCGIRLHYQPGRLASGSGPADLESSWQHTPWGRLFVGVLVAQGLFYILRHLCTAGFLVASDASATGVWATLTGLILLQGMQAVSIFSAGLLMGAGQRRGMLYGAVVGMWNSAFFFALQWWTGQSITAVNLSGEPILHVAFGVAGGLVGRMIWRPSTALPGMTRMRTSVGRTVRRGTPSRLAGPIAWTRVITGVTIAVAGVLFAEVIRDFVIEASEGKLRIDTRLQAELVTWEVEILALLAGSAFAGATTINGMKQGLAVGIGTGLLLLAIRLPGAHAQPSLWFGPAVSALAVGLAGGWFGGNLLPPVYGARRKSVGPEPI